MDAVIENSQTIQNDFLRMPNLSVEQEVSFKNLLIRHAIEKELEGLLASNSVQYLMFDTVFLRFIYQKLLLEFPLLKRKCDVIRPKLENLFVNQFPKMTSLSRKANRKDEKLDSSIFVPFFDMIMKTPKEFALKASEKLSIPNTDSNETENMKKKANKIMKSIFEEILLEGSAKSFLFSIIDAKSISELPISLQKLFDIMSKAVAIKVYEELSIPSTLFKIKLLYALMPVTIIKGILKISNPIKMISWFMEFLFARPLGSKSLLQKMLEYISELSKTEKLIKFGQKEIRKQFGSNLLLQKIENWVALEYYPIPKENRTEDINLLKRSSTNGHSFKKNEAGTRNTFDPIEELISEKKLEVIEVLGSQKVEPCLDSETISHLTEENIRILHTVIHLEMRKKEKKEFISLFGNEELLSELKEIILVLYRPLIDLYSNCNLSILFEATFEMIHTFISIAEESPIKAPADDSSDPYISNEQHNSRSKLNSKKSKHVQEVVTNWETSRTNMSLKRRGDTDTPLKVQSEYYMALKSFEELCLEVLQSLMRGNREVFSELIMWLVSLFQLGGKIQFPLEKLLTSVDDPSLKQKALNELDYWIRYKSDLIQQQQENYLDHVAEQRFVNDDELEIENGQAEKRQSYAAIPPNQPIIIDHFVRPFISLMKPILLHDVSNLD